MPIFFRRRLKRVLVRTAAVGLLFTICFSVRSAQADTPVHTVIMKSISYDPKTIDIQQGDKVVWNNQSYTNHSATSDMDAAFDTGMVAPKARSREVVFNHVGTFSYHCSLHGKSMSGEITVHAQGQAHSNSEGK